MSSQMDATPGTILLECVSCHVLKPTAICYCDAELCEACTPTHLQLCASARVRQFRTWIPKKREKRTT